MAQHKYWPGESAVGKYITIIRDAPVPRRIVGVVGDVKAAIEADPPPSMYVSYRQMSFPSMQIVMLCRDPSNSALVKLRQAVHSVDPEQPVEYVASMQSIVREALDPWRLALLLLGGLAALGTVLTAVGLFAVVSYLIREKARELGVRMAAGATRGDIMTLVLGQSLKLALIGCAIGFVLAGATTRIMTSTEYAIHPKDPGIFLAVAIFVAGVAVAAAYIPARRAARSEPLSALREE